MRKNTLFIMAMGLWLAATGAYGISNGDFSDGDDHWTEYEYRAEVYFTDDWVRFRSNDASYVAMIYQQETAFVEGETWEFEVDITFLGGYGSAIIGWFSESWEGEYITVSSSGTYTVQTSNHEYNTVFIQTGYSGASFFFADNVSTTDLTSPSPSPTSSPTPSDTPTPTNIGFTFDSDMEGWGFQVISGFDTPIIGYDDGKLSLAPPPNSAYCYGFWQSDVDAIPYIPNSLYRVQWVLSTNQYDEALVPSVRLRLEPQSAIGSSALLINSLGDSNDGLTYYDRTFDHYYMVPNLDSIQDNEYTDDLFLAFELLDFTEEDEGTVFLDYVVVDRFDADGIDSFATIKTYDSAEDFANWVFTPIFQGAENNGARSAAGLAILSFGLMEFAGEWLSPANDVYINPGYLHRATFTVFCDFPPEDIPSLRLRIGTEDLEIYSMVVALGSVVSIENAPLPMSQGGREYAVFLNPPAPDSGNVGEDSLQFGFDMIDFSSNNASFILDTVVVDILLPPEIP